MIAPSYARQRSELARASRLGRTPATAAPTLDPQGPSLQLPLESI
ncbi:MULTISPECIES: hypothetical protein [unclassified Sinorhizobium]